jgi:hypothetical protein
MVFNVAEFTCTSCLREVKTETILLITVQEPVSGCPVSRTTSDHLVGRICYVGDEWYPLEVTNLVPRLFSGAGDFPM